MTNHRATAERFINLTRNAGAAVSVSHAGTGTVYVTVLGEAGEIKVRFADHGECYCREDISVDPDGCSYEQAVRATMTATGVDLSRSLRALKAAAARRAKAAAEAAALRAPILAAAEAQERARVEFQARFVAEKLAARPADAGEPSKKALKRYRAEANVAFAAL